MNIIKYALFVAALSLPVTNTHALEWVDYDGTIPDNAVSVNEGTEDRPICRRNARIGLIKNDKCHSVKAGGSFDKKEIDDGYQILVDTYNVYDAVQAGTDMYTQTDLDAAVAAATQGSSVTEDMFTQTDIDDAVAEATEDMLTQTDIDDAVAEATEDMYTQAEYDAEVTALASLQAAYDALIGSGDNASYTQYEYENAVFAAVQKGLSIYAANLSYFMAGDGAGMLAAVNEDREEYMEGICSGEVDESSGACVQN